MDAVNRRDFLALTASLTAVPAWAQQVTNDDDHGQGNLDRPSEALRTLEAALTPTGRVPLVATHSYDNLRSGATLGETQLTPERVRNGLRPVFTVTLGGDARGLEAQPLLVPNVATLDGVLHDLLVLTSMGNIAGAFDAHDGTPIWVRRLATPIQGSRAIDIWLVNDKWGVLSTGVIVGQVLYCVAWQSPDASTGRASHVLYALNLRDGTNAKPPLTLVTPNTAMQRKQRAALTYTNVGGRQTIFIPYATIQETADGSHGFIQAVDLATWKVVVDWNSTPTGRGAGIWQAGQGLVADAEGFLYGISGNGSYDGRSNFGESFLKLSFDGTTLRVIDHYSPFRDNQRGPHYDDMDLGSGAPSLIPELGLLFGAGKDGILYTLPWRRLSQPAAPPIWYTFYPGPNVPAAPPPDQLLFNRTHHMHGSSVTWKTGGQWRAFAWGENGNLRAWRFDGQGAHFLGNGAEVSSVNAPVPPGGMPGAFLCLSANGENDGIVWCTVPLGDANRTVTRGQLLAYDAQTLGKWPDGSGALQLLWRSPDFVYNKFMPPVAAGGKVYVPTYDGKVLVFGV